MAAISFVILAPSFCVCADAPSEWEAALAAAAGRMVELIPPGQTLSPSMQATAAAESEALRQLLAQSLLDQPAKEQALDELAARLGVPREIVRPDGSKMILSGEMAGSPVWISNPEGGMFGPVQTVALPANSGGIQMTPGTLIPVSGVPEPGSTWLLAMGIITALGIRFRRRLCRR